MFQGEPGIGKKNLLASILGGPQKEGTSRVLDGLTLGTSGGENRGWFAAVGGARLLFVPTKNFRGCFPRGRFFVWVFCFLEPSGVILFRSHRQYVLLWKFAKAVLCAAAGVSCGRAGCWKPMARSLGWCGFEIFEMSKVAFYPGMVIPPEK